MKPGIAAAVGLSLALFGCASFGPLESPEFDAKLKQDIAIPDGAAAFHSPTTIFPNTVGYELPGALLFQRYQEQGVLVLGSENAYFVVWKRDGKYEERLRFPYVRVSLIELRSLGLGRRVVVKFDKLVSMKSGSSLGAVSFDVSTDSGQRIDPERSETACDIIAQRSRKTCVRP